MNHSDIEHMAQGFPPSHIGKDAEEVITHLATELLKFQEQRDALAAENAGMDRFVDSLLSIAWQGGSADGSDIQELALKHGLIRQESYCADSHENLVEDAGNFEEGDEVYFRVETPATTAYLNSVRADAVQELADAWYAIANETSDGVSIGDSTRLKYGQRADDAADFAAQLRAGELA
ncbi:hypothetical protein [Duffyella gerundensis]|uniref:hypothetical protein n=1 Tax=Duffyella TaxID=3026546 RepID=UPI003F6E2291